MRHALLTLALALPLLAACQLNLPGLGEPAVAASAGAGDAITTTTLDAPPTAANSVSPPPAAATASIPEAAPQDASASDVPAPSEPADSTAPPVAQPIAQKSAAQIACEKDGGSWARAGAGGGRACVRPTRDGGKQCRRKTDCQGECLARSRTCAPIRPLFGCNAVLMDNGAEVNLCID